VETKVKENFPSWSMVYQQTHESTLTLIAWTQLEHNMKKIAWHNNRIIVRNDDNRIHIYTWAMKSNSHCSFCVKLLAKSVWL
jgi:hypothetical protein